MASQRFCLRWNNHQTNLLAVFDQLLHDETFIDVTLAVEGQHLKAHKMVLSACSPYFQQLFVSHPEKHPIVILRDVPFKDMKCLLDFMYRGEVSVDQDRLAAFLRVAESLRIKGLTEVNDDKPIAPTSTGTTTTTSTVASSASGAAQGAGAVATNAVPSASAQKNSSGDSVTHVDDDDEDRCSPASNSISIASSVVTAAGQVQSTGTGHLKQLPPLLSSTGIVTRSHSNSLLQQHHQGGNSNAMLQTNPLLGTALSQQKRKRGRPRKLSGSDAGEGETDGSNFIDGGAGEEYDSNSMDIMDVKIASSSASNSGDDDQQLRIVSSRTEDCDTPMHEKSEQMDDDDDEEMDDDELVEDDDLETGDEPRGTTPSLDESLEVTTGNNATHNANSNRTGRQQHQRQGGNSSGTLAKPSRASKRSRMATSENSNMSDLLHAGSLQTELSIFPINLEKKNHQRYPEIVIEEEKDCDNGKALVIADPAPPLHRSNRSILREFKFPLLKELQRKGALQELTITEHRRTSDIHEIVVNQNGNELKDDSSSPPPMAMQADNNSNVDNGRAIDSTYDLKKEIDLKQHRTPKTGPKGPKRRTRKSQSPNDPAEALTEMSVRGLDLFRYATIKAGMYQCMECNKDGIDSTFKNKYSFQRHAFLYHEGKQRKVFPCPVCSKEFSRPDKMKNHLRMLHESYETKMFMYRRHPEEPSLLQMHPPQQQHYNHHHQAANSVSMQQLEEEQRRRQQEQDVMKIRSVVHAINLRQLQHFQQQQEQQQRELGLRQSLEEQNRQQPIITKQMDAPTVPAQLIALNGVGSQ
ncbi:protein tramtrack, alpha isoform isoform X2 [Anopheles moucheti]|uniref:protein tramtrack, alpha isoform isoform X2 n=1 Tax=Anopheles moucheti TaxID=186751 RepID=UPI0022F13B69|nr:protein tramtrack, alpha isoform isoform X2 [Anopheles moucheti]